jgi:type I restriction enzyme S subunit
MNSEWTIMPLSEIVNFNPTYSIKKGTIIPYVEMAAVPENTREIAYFENREFSNGSKFKNGDTLFSRITPCLQNGKTARVSGLKESEIANGSTEFIVMSAKDIDDKDFIYYLALNKEFRNYAEGRMEGTTGRQRVSWQALSEYEFLIPPKVIRQKIAHILSTLDDKIELNRKMNQTLEDMAQTIFKSWFVDFDPVHAKANCTDEAELENIAKELGISKEILDLFPSEFIESEMGMIPKGWEVKAISSIGQVITGKTPPTTQKENYGDRYPFITIPDMHNQVYITKTERYLSDVGNNVQKNKLIPKNSLIVSCIATVGLISINSEDSHTNQQINSIVCDEKNLYYLYFILKNMKETLIMYGSSGTATLNVNKSTFENIEFIKSSDILIQRFFKFVNPIFGDILENTKQIQILEKTRDTLLPKLLSGEIDVSDLELKV